MDETTIVIVAVVLVVAALGCGLGIGFGLGSLRLGDDHESGEGRSSPEEVKSVLDAAPKETLFVDDISDDGGRPPSPWSPSPSPEVATGKEYAEAAAVEMTEAEYVIEPIEPPPEIDYEFEVEKAREKATSGERTTISPVLPTLQDRVDAARGFRPPPPAIVVPIAVRHPKPQEDLCGKESGPSPTELYVVTDQKSGAEGSPRRTSRSDALREIAHLSQIEEIERRDLDEPAVDWGCANITVHACGLAD